MQRDWGNRELRKRAPPGACRALGWARQAPGFNRISEGITRVISSSTSGLVLALYGVGRMGEIGRDVIL